MDQAKSQWDQVRLLLQVNRPTQQRPDLPLDFQPCVWGVFSAPQRDKKGLSLPEPRWCAQHYHDSRRNSYYHRTKGKGEDFSGAMWGEETDPALLSTISGGYRNSLVSTLGVQQRPGDLTKGPVSPGAGSGDCMGLPPSAWVRLLCPEAPYLQFTCSVSCPL